MRVVNSYIFRAICAMLAGILLVANPQRMTELMVQIIGGLFLVSGLVSMINYFAMYFSSHAAVKPVFPIVGLGSLLFGVFLGFFPDYFITYLMFVLGILLVVAGINQIWNMIRFRRLIPFRWYIFLLAFLFLVVGAVIIFMPMESASLPFVILGASCIVYGVSELVNGVRWRKYNKQNSQIMIEEKPED